MPKREPRTYSECTAYKFFKECYWGRFQLSGKAAHPNQAIVEARNQFVVDHRIVAYKHNNSAFHIHDLRGQDTWKNKRVPYFVSSLDHQEFWVDEEKRIVHIYSHHKHLGIHPAFRSIPALYALDQITCLRKIETTFSKKKLMKTLFSKIPDDAVLLIQQYLAKPRRAKRTRH